MSLLLATRRAALNCAGHGAQGGGGSKPLAPTGLVATPGLTSVALSWTASAGAADYDVWRGTSSGAETLLAEDILGTTFTDTGDLLPGATYYYYVAANNSAGQSPASNEVTALITTPALGLTRETNGPNLVTESGAYLLVAGASVSFSPLSLSPVLWLDAANASSLFQLSSLTTPAVSNNDPVGGQVDQSTSVNNATQATAGNRASLQTGANGINGKNALLYNNTTAFLQLGSMLTVTGPITIYAVGKRAASTAWWVFGQTGISQYVAIYLDNSIYLKNAGGQVTAAYTGSTGNIAVRWRRDASNNIYFASTGMSEVLLGNMAGNISVNALGASPINPGFNGGANLHAEQLVCAADLMTSNLAGDVALRAYLAAKWGPTIP